MNPPIRQVSLRAQSLLLFLLVSLCQPGWTEGEADQRRPFVVQGGDDSVSAPAAMPRFIQADRGADGNRLAVWEVPLVEMQRSTITIEKAVVWAVAIPQNLVIDTVPLQADAVWILQFSDGTHSWLWLQDGEVGIGSLPSVRGDASSLTVFVDGQTHNVSLLGTGEYPAAALLPMPLADAGDNSRWAFPFEETPLADGHIAVGPENTLAYLSQPTSEYAHAVLGNNIEAGGLTLISNRGTRSISFGDDVAEERGVLISDLGQDGNYEIITVLANRSQGARLAAFDFSLETAAEGVPVGRGFRWRHLIGAGPLGPNSEHLVAAVRTPHIGGVVEYYDENLNIMYSIPGYSSHAIRSANLGDALIAPVDRIGNAELILPVQRRDRIEALTLTRRGHRVVWRYNLNGTLSSNLSYGERGLLAADSAGTVHIWWY